MGYPCPLGGFPFPVAESARMGNWPNGTERKQEFHFQQRIKASSCQNLIKSLRDFLFAQKM